MQGQRSGGLFLRMLTEAERRASAGAGAAAAMLGDRAALGAVLDGLKRPSAGAAYTAWAASAELAQAARVAARLMQHGDSTAEPSLLLQRACIAAAQVSAQTSGWKAPTTTLVLLCVSDLAYAAPCLHCPCADALLFFRMTSSLSPSVSAVMCKVTRVLQLWLQQAGPSLCIKDPARLVKRAA